MTIGHAELAASHTVTQIVEVLEVHQKDARLVALLQKYHASRTNRVLCFALYKKEADRMERMLQQRGWKCAAIHGDMSQEARTRALAAFKSGESPLLVATDVAARGLDIPNVEYVINVTFPLTIEDYVHRIGRTGRAGSKGIAHTLFTPLDKAHRCGGGTVHGCKGGQCAPSPPLPAVCVTTLSGTCSCHAYRNLCLPCAPQPRRHCRAPRARAPPCFHLHTRRPSHCSGELINVLRDAGAPVPPELLKFGTHVKKKEHGLCEWC